MIQEYLTRDQVEHLMDHVAYNVDTSSCDPGIDPRSYLLEILRSKEFFAFFRLMATMPGTYEDFMDDVIRDVLPWCFTEFVRMYARTFDNNPTLNIES